MEESEVEFRCVFIEKEDRWVINVYLNGEFKMLRYFDTTDEVCSFMKDTFDIRR